MVLGRDAGAFVGDGDEVPVVEAVGGDGDRRAFRREPDIPGRNWNEGANGPNTNVGGFAGKTWAMVEAGSCPVELTYNWDQEEPYATGRFFGHLAFAVDDIYETCARLQAHGIVINRPPRDGRMAFVKSPDGQSIELLQANGALEPAEPWVSMENTGSW